MGNRYWPVVIHATSPRQRTYGGTGRGNWALPSPYSLHRDECQDEKLVTQRWRTFDPCDGARSRASKR